MGRNTRGKIKEHLEGMHRNTEAYKAHVAACMDFIGDSNPKARLAFDQLWELNTVLDEFTQNLYGSI